MYRQDLPLNDLQWICHKTKPSQSFAPSAHALLTKPVRSALLVTPHHIAFG